MARKEDYDLYESAMTMPRTREAFSENLHPYLRWWRQRTGTEEVTTEEILRCRTAYWGLVTRMDAMIGRSWSRYLETASATTRWSSTRRITGRS